jgi:hypothetical protein
VFLRIGSAESDEQLQSAVSKFLPPVLLKLSSQQDGVRKKVHKFCEKMKFMLYNVTATILPYAGKEGREY